ncbi:uncharacterized protein LOC129598691, partial [Paramacrobiotus metropolitanus]|uniref:uncharacterized protein LOC129598691 n=1 Tax=Paramacrobiotus metropolitanus TaxID=2943436 RepID=UPI0024456913
GLSRPWLLIGESLTSVADHFEDCLFNSISVNFGPGVKIWTVFPVLQIEKVVRMYASLFGCSDPDYPSVCFVQEPGTVMYLGPGVLHSVVNLGGTVSQARNFVDERWLSVVDTAILMREKCSKLRQDGNSKVLFSWMRLLRERLSARSSAAAQLVNGRRFPVRQFADAKEMPQPNGPVVTGAL